MNNVQTMFLCFDSEERNTCRALSLKNDELYTDLRASDFFEVFEANVLPNSIYPHSQTTIVRASTRRFKINNIRIVSQTA